MVEQSLPPHYSEMADGSGRITFGIFFSIASALWVHSGSFCSKSSSHVIYPFSWICGGAVHVCTLDYLQSRRLLAWACVYLFIIAEYHRLQAWRVSFVEIAASRAVRLSVGALLNANTDITLAL